MPRRARLFAIVGLIALASPVARAADFKINKEPLRLDLTESMYLSAHLDDGNPDPTTKNYGEMVNRLTAQLAWRKFLFSVRFDSGAWLHTPQIGDHSPYVSPPGTVPPLDCPAAPDTLRKCVVQPDSLIPDPDPYAAPGTNMRFRDGLAPIKRGVVPVGIGAFYLEKIAISYSDRSFDATLGDFYVSLGRGLVLSIRKLDELGTDTTVTGGKFAFRVKDKNVELSGVALAGFTNVQNFDQARAQYIPDPNDFVSAVHVDARLFNRVLVGAHAMFGKPACPYGQMCRETDFSDDIRLRPGVMVDAPKLTKWLGLYAEYARRQDRTGGKDQEGDAVYAAANIYAGRTAWLAEFKHYVHYLPWHAANDPFGSIVYQQPPTLERITTQISNNTDITAGRVRLDVRVNPSLSVHWSGEIGRAMLAEGVYTDLVDIYAGAEARWNEGHSHFFPVLGFRNERREKHDDEKTGLHVEPEVEERLWSAQWDGTQVLGKRFSVETQGVIWFRRKGLEAVPGSGDNEWREGNVYVSLKWAPKLVLSAGYEFTTIAKEQANTHHFFNGQILWNITSGTSLALFAGGNRPGLKCVSGVCRDFPAFQGVRLEFVLRL